MVHTIRVNNVSKKIGSKQIVKDICLELKGGNVYGFVGENGSGKTMLFRVISGLIKPTLGEVLLDEVNVHKKNNNKIGIILENSAMWPELTGLENLMYLSRLNNYITKEDVINTMLRVGLDYENKLPTKKYSLGMKQRLMVAQAIMEKPDFIFLDEPTNAIDSKGIDLIYKIILEEAKRGAVILLASHVSQDISKLCNEVYYMEKGRCRKVRDTDD